MINDSSKNFIEECILQQNKINANSTHLEVYNINPKLLSHAPTPTSEPTTQTTIPQQLLQYPANIQIEKKTTTNTDGRHIIMYQSHLRGRAMKIFNQIRLFSETTSSLPLINHSLP